MRYAQIIPNDVINGEGICVSFFVQGCPHHCPGCFNPETWDFNKGIPYTSDTKWELVKLISDNNFMRNFCVLGGEPLAPQNLPMTQEVIQTIRHAYPNIKIYLWTGYLMKDLEKSLDKNIQSILSNINYLIDGPFIESAKDLSLYLRGSSNQMIWENVQNTWVNIDGKYNKNGNTKNNSRL